jgi:NADH-quinone oxidoreductase subunit E
LQHLSGLLGIPVGGTTGDGIFTLLPCCCLGNCGQAPTLMIGDTLYGSLTPERAAEILQQERQKL